MTKPTREQIKSALEWVDTERAPGTHPMILAAAYRATKRPAQIIGRAIGYIIAAAIGVMALSGLLVAIKALVGVMG